VNIVVLSPRETIIGRYVVVDASDEDSTKKLQDCDWNQLSRKWKPVCNYTL
jgi:hypothetical protein